MAEVIIQEALAKAEGTEHPLPRETLSGPGTPHKQQVACRTSNIHARALNLLQAAQIDLRSALASLPHVLQVNDFLSSAKADIKEAFALLPTLSVAHSDLQKAVCGSAVACPCAMVGKARAEEMEEKEELERLRTLLSLLDSATAWVECNRGSYEKACKATAEAT